MPENADAWTHLGLAQEREGQRALALAALERAVDLDPGYFGAVSGLAEIYNSKQRVAETVALIDRFFVASREGVDATLGLLGHQTYSLGLLQDRPRLEAALDKAAALLPQASFAERNVWFNSLQCGLSFFDNQGLPAMAEMLEKFMDRLGPEVERLNAVIRQMGFSDEVRGEMDRLHHCQESPDWLHEMVFASVAEGANKDALELPAGHWELAAALIRALLVVDGEQTRAEWAWCCSEHPALAAHLGGVWEELQQGLPLRP